MICCLRGRCHSDNLNVPACNKCIRIKMSRNEYASWLLSVIGEPCNSQLRICDIYITCFYSNDDESNLRKTNARYLQLFNFDRLDFMSHALGIESTD